MASERETRQHIEEEVQLDPEGTASGSTKTARSFDRQAPDHDNDHQTEHVSANGKLMTANGEVNQDRIEGEPIIAGDEDMVDAAAIANAAPMENVERIRNDDGSYAFWFNPPSEAERYGVKRQHLGNVGKNGQGMGAIAEKAAKATAAMNETIAHEMRTQAAGMDNRKIGPDGREQPEDDMAAHVIITEGHNLSPNPVDDPDAFERQQTEYQRLADEQIRNETRPQGEAGDGSSGFGNPGDHDNSQNLFTTEALYAGERRDDRESALAAASIIPQEARDTPHEPLRANKPYKTRAYGVMPPGEFAPEPKPPLPRGGMRGPEPEPE